MSQLGATRLRLPAGGHLLAPTNWCVLVDEVIEELLPPGTATPVGAVGLLAICRHSFANAGSRALTVEQEGAIHAALTPVARVTVGQILAEPEVAAEVAAIQSRIPISVGTIVADWLNIARNSQQLVARARDLCHDQGDNATVIAAPADAQQVQINVPTTEQLLSDDVSVTDAMLILAAVNRGGMPEATREAAEDFLAEKVRREDPNDLLSLAHLKPLTTGARARLQRQVFRMPQLIATKLDESRAFTGATAAYTGNFVLGYLRRAGAVAPDVAFRPYPAVPAVGVQDVIILPVGPGNVYTPQADLSADYVFVNSLGGYTGTRDQRLVVSELFTMGVGEARLMALKSVYAAVSATAVRGEGRTEELAAMFGVSRANVADRGLYVDSSEVLDLPAMPRGLDMDPVSNIVGILPGSLVNRCMDLLVDPYAVEAGHYVSIISFMKSGHHGTAAGIANTYMKVLNALQVKMGEEAARMAAVATVYYGPHPASTRLSLLAALNDSRVNDLSFAITRRLLPDPPGTVAYTTLMLFLKALERGEYFAGMNRVQEFRAFCSAYERWREDSHLEAPYAQYLYGNSRAENQSIKVAAGAFMPLAAGIGHVMPDSTLTLSVALQREARAAAANDIVGPLTVRAFASYTVQSAGRMFRQALAAQGGGAAAQQMALPQP